MNYVIGLFSENGDAFPIQRISYDVEVRIGFAHYSLTSIAYNPTSFSLQSYFYFPVSALGVVCGFSAYIDGTIFKSKVLSINEASETVKSHPLTEVQLMQIRNFENLSEMIRVPLGILKPKSTVAVTVQYLRTLEVTQSKFLKLCIPSNQTPLFDPKSRDFQSSCELSNKAGTSLPLNMTVSNSYPWHIRVRIEDDFVSQVFCISHEDVNININPQNGRKIISLMEEQDNFPTHDFVIVFDTEKINEPFVKLAVCNNFDYVTNQPDEEEKRNRQGYSKINSAGTYIHNNNINELINGRTFSEIGLSQNMIMNPPKYCAVISLVPDLNPVSKQEAYQNLLKKVEFEGIHFYKKTQEFYFLLDRSKSMAGQRLHEALSALKIFLKSLPLNSYFNVISFGETVHYIFDDEYGSVKYTKENEKYAIQKITEMKASLGGTEINAALESVFLKPHRTRVRRNIFLLTDGVVGNSDLLVNYINQVCKSTKTRVFTLGLGEAVNDSFIRDAAEAGNGIYCKVYNDNDITKALINLLNKALQPCVKKFQIEYNEKDPITFISGLPHFNTWMTANEDMKAFIFIDKKLENVEKIPLTVTYYHKKSCIKKNLVIDFNKIENTDLAHIYGIKKMLDHFDKKEINNFYVNEKYDTSSIGAYMSIASNILSYDSAFCIFSQEIHLKEKINYLDAELLNVYNKFSFQSQTKIIFPDILYNNFGLKCTDSNHNCTLIKSIQSVAEYSPYINIHITKRPPLSSAIKKVTHYFVTPNSDIVLTGNLVKDYLINGHTNCVQLYKDDADLEKTLGLIEIDGYWSDISELSKTCGFSKRSLKQNIPKEFINHAVKDNIWLTVAVLCWLEKIFFIEKDQWQIIKKKAIVWLASKGIYNYLAYERDLNEVYFRNRIPHAVS